MSIPLTATMRVGAIDELTFTPQGTARQSLRLVASKRIKDDAGQWTDGPATWITATAWRDLAEALAETGLTTGTEVLVTGELKERTFTTRDGSERTIVELDLRAIAPTITTRQRVTVTRPTKRTDTTGNQWNTEPWETR